MVTLYKRLLPLIIGVAALAGCESTGPKASAVASTAAASEQVFTGADNAIAAKQD